MIEFNFNVFKDEKINYNEKLATKNLPARLKEARKLEKSSLYVSSADLFVKQAKMLENYEDDYEFKGNPARYYPTYQSLNNEELRGYFAWRTKVRHGNLALGPFTFIILYIQEIINQIGVVNPQDGYGKILRIYHHFKPNYPFLADYVENWLSDYVIYYDLPPLLLNDNEIIANGKAVSILDNINNESEENIYGAIVQLGSKWFKRSKFYNAHAEDVHKVIVNTIKRMKVHYEKSCKKTFVEQYFGPKEKEFIYPFSSAIFADPLKRKNFIYKVHQDCIIECKRGRWSIYDRFVDNRILRKFIQLVKTIDNSMRSSLNFGHPIKSENSLKWVNAIIKEEIDNLITQKNKKLIEESRAQRPALDLSMLDKIREDANATRDKLAIDEEIETETEFEKTGKPLAEVVGMPLSDHEARLLKCLLNGNKIDWVKNEGLMLSVLVDGINEKLYDIFGDSVIDENQTPVDDYIDELRELVKE